MRVNPAIPPGKFIGAQRFYPQQSTGKMQKIDCDMQITL
jgi:hypothetical protein